MTQNVKKKIDYSRKRMFKRRRSISSQRHSKMLNLTMTMRTSQFIGGRKNQRLGDEKETMRRLRGHSEDKRKEGYVRKKSKKLVNSKKSKRKRMKPTDS